MSFSGNFGSNPFQPGGFGGELDKIRDSFKDKGATTSASTVATHSTPLQEGHDEIYRSLVKRLVAFEDQLPSEEETAMRLTSFGEPATLRVENLSHHRPGLVVFYGYDEQGRHVELVQHVGQLSFLLTGVPRSNPDEPRREKGFHRAARDLFDQLAESSDPPVQNQRGAGSTPDHETE